MGRRRLAHPRPPARAGRPAEPAGADRPGQKDVLRSTVPTHSWAAWPSFLTGVDPVDHGVYDILETVPGTHKQYPVTYKSIKARTFLDDLTAAGKNSCCCDVPLTFPPPDITGNLIAGGVLPKGRSVSYPADLQDTLAKAGHEWPINGMSWTTYRNRPDAYLDEAFEVTGKRIAATEWLMDNTDWDLMATVWVSVDRTQHALSNYIAPDHPDYAEEPPYPRGGEGRRHLQAARRRDRLVPVALQARRPGPVHLRPRVPVVHARDPHGPPAEAVRLPGVLAPRTWSSARCSGDRCATSRARSTTLLGLHGKVSLPQSINWSKTKAYTSIRSTGEGVSINLAGREPDGIVDPADYEKVRDELMDRLASFVDPKTGKKPVKAIFKREEIFKGKYADNAPDILMEPAEGYSLTHAKSAIEDADWVSGDHRIDGVIVAAGPRVKPFTSTPKLIDMAPTILAALDAPTAVKHTGRVLHEVVGAERREVAPSRRRW